VQEKITIKAQLVQNTRMETGGRTDTTDRTTLPSNATVGNYFYRASLHAAGSMMAWMSFGDAHA